MSNNSSAASNGIGFPGLLTIVFIIFKLLGKIAWSWWWVFSPLWIFAGIVVVILTALLALWILSELL